jgi:hypothetical protein
VSALVGFVIPSGTPRTIVQKIQSDTARVLANPEVKKPYLYPLYAEGNKSVTREINWSVKAEDKNKTYDHVHHKGIWISVDEVNKHKHWVEKALVVNKSLKQESTNTQHTAVLTAVNEWLAVDQSPLLEETTRMTFHANRVIDFEIKLTALAPEIEIEDTKEGFLAVRMPDDLREQTSGLIQNSNGKKTEKECWGQQASWVDYSGKRGDEFLGIAIFDSPMNPNTARYHVRAYGLFTANPFGDKAYTEKSPEPQPAKPVHLKQGASYKVNYAIYIHTGDTAAAKVAEEFNSYSHRQKHE